MQVLVTNSLIRFKIFDLEAGFYHIPVYLIYSPTTAVAILSKQVINKVGKYTINLSSNSKFKIICSNCESKKKKMFKNKLIRYSTNVYMEIMIH